MKRVAILQRVLPHYRIAFFTGLHAALANAGIALELVYGQEQPGTVPRTVALEATWAHRVENRYLDVRGQELVWQPVWARLSTADLVIVEQANRLLLNYALLARRCIRAHPKLAYWGHGKNFQAASSRSAAERLKRALAHRADWWFAYTDESARVIAEAGVARDRVTVVNNAIDTDGLRRARDVIAQADARTALGIARDARVAVFCGGLQPSKQLGFLLAACERLRKRIPTFELIVVGDGPERSHLPDASWIHAVGERFGDERARYFAAADIMMMPANVGLAVLDSFATATPLYTTLDPSHGPEAGYLVDGTNAAISPLDIDAYVASVASAFMDPGKLRALREGCRAGARRYTLEAMVDRFSSGVTAALTH